MSLTGDFDVALPIAANALGNLIMQQMPDQLPVKKPVALGPVTLPLMLGGKQGNATLYAILRKLTAQIVDVSGVATLRLLLRYDHASFSGAVIPQQICPVAGSLTVDVAIGFSSTPIANSTNFLRQTQAEFATANVTNKFDDDTVAKALPGAGDAVGNAVTTAFKGMLTQLVPNGGRIALGPAIPFNPVGGGSLMPLVATRLEIKALSGGLVLFANVDASTKAAGNVNNKPSLALPSGSNIALQVSAGCFHRQIFCPGLAKQFNVAVGSLPTSCGNGSVPYFVAQANETVNITELADTFQNGRILIEGQLSKSGTCYTFTGGFHGQITFQDATLSPKFDLLESHSNFDVPLLCKALGALLGTLTGGVLFGALAVFGIDKLESGIRDSISKGLAKGLKGLVPPSGGLDTTVFDGVAFTKIDITSEGLSVEGFLPTKAFAWTDVQSSASLEGATSTTNSQVIEQGTVLKNTACDLQKKQYSYTLQTVNETAAYDIVLNWVVKPLLKTDWRLLVPNAANTASDVYPLTADTGKVNISQIQTTMPNLEGTVTSPQAVSLAYTVSSTGISLTNLDPKKGGYSVVVEATCTLCGGETRTISRTLQFLGMVLDILGYDEAVNACSAMLAGAVQGMNSSLILTTNPTLLQKVNYPPPEQFTQFYQTMVRLAQSAGADTTQVATMLASGHVGSMVRATLASDARRFSVLNASSPAAASARQQSALEAANVEINTAQAGVDQAQQRLAEAQAMAADVRTTLAAQGRS